MKTNSAFFIQYSKVGPRYICESQIENPKICSHIMNSHVKGPNRKLEERFQKKAIFQLHIREIADKKTAYNEGRLYLKNGAGNTCSMVIEIVL